MRMQKYILFGAGDYGKKALRYYGAENVECFVDNDMRKIGIDYCGKTIINFERLKEISENYKVVISSRYYTEISEQLDSAGITGYLVFLPERQKVLERLLSYNLAQGEFKSIALYGIDSYSQTFIQSCLASEFGKKIKYIADEDNSGYVGEDIEGFRVKALPEIASDIDALIITAGKKHLAVRGLLGKKYGHLFKVIDPFKKLALYETDEIVFDRYIGKKEFSEDEWIEVNANSRIIQAVGDYVDIVAADVPLFEFVELETINRCNGTCKFCPANKHVDPRQEMFMSFDLYTSIVDQLSALDYSGYFAPFSNGEPLLDERITELVKYAKERLPSAHIYLYTNGTLFTIEKFKEIMRYLDELVIDNYTQNLELIKPCREIKDYVERHEELRKKVTISIRNPDEILTSRGGDAPNRNRILSFDDAKCALPFRQMVVRPDGKVSLCCNDPFGKYTLGDLTKQSILDVWYGEEYGKIREAIFKGRKHLAQCQHCDTFLLL